MQQDTFPVSKDEQDQTSIVSLPPSLGTVPPQERSAQEVSVSVPLEASLAEPSAEPVLFFSNKEDQQDLLGIEANAPHSSPFIFPFQPSAPMPALDQTEIVPSPSPAPSPPPREQPTRRLLRLLLIGAVVLITLAGGSLLVVAQSPTPSVPMVRQGSTPPHSIPSPTSPPSSPLSKSPTPPVKPGPPTRPAAVPPMVERQDDFHRTDRVGGWGTATGGLDWQITDRQNLPAFSVRGGVGLITATRSNAAFYTATLGAPLVTQVIEMSTSFQVQGLSAQTNMGVVMRYHDANNYYKAYLSGRDVVLMKNVKGHQTVLSRWPFVAHAGFSYRLRVQVNQNVLMAKVWRTDQVEPGWMVGQIDPTFTTGQVGIRSLLLPGNRVQVFAFQVSER